MSEKISTNILSLLNRKIFCLGDLMLDNYILGNTLKSVNGCGCGSTNIVVK